MPAVVPFLAVIAGPVGLGWIGATAAAWITVGSAVAIGLYERDKAKRAERRSRSAYNASLQDRLLTIRSAVSERRYVLGTVRTSGTLLYADTVGLNQTALDSVIALAANRCELTGYYFGEDYVSAANFPGNKYGEQKEIEAHETFTVTGVSGSVTLAARPKDGTTIRGTRRLAPGRSLPINVSMGAGTTLNYSGGANTTYVIDIRYTIAASTRIRAIFKNGDPAQGPSAWADHPTPLWTANHLLRGVCHLRTLMLWDESLFAPGAPVVGAVLRGGWIDGHEFFDPRASHGNPFGSFPVYTDNPAILAGWWMTLPRWRGGCGIPADWIDWDSIAAAANICDELVTVRTLDGAVYEQIKRYQCHTVLSTGTAPLENLDIVLSAMAGRRCFTAGKYRIFAGAFRAAARTISDADIIGTKPIATASASGNDSPPNIVTARFADATKDWQETSPKPVRNSSYISADGHESPLDISLPATTDPRQANYLMGVALESARPAFAVTLTVGGIGEDIALYDTVALSISNRPAYTGKTFEVLSITEFDTGEFELGLAEIRTQTWALDPDSYTPSNPVPVPDLSYLWSVAQPTGFTVTVGEPQTLPDGNAVTLLTLTWAQHPQPYVRESGYFELRYAEASREWSGTPNVPGDATSTTFSASLTDGGYYYFQIRAINGLGARSGWTTFALQLDGTELAVGVQGPGIFTWANPVNVSTTSSSITKTAGGAAYDAGAHSLQSYTGGCFVSARCGQVGTRRVIGLNGDPAVDAGMLGIDYAIALTQTNVLQIYESGILIGSFGAYTADTLLAVKYDNANIVYEKDGTPIRTIAPGANRRFFLDVSLFELGATLVDIAFGPMGGVGPQGLPGVAAQAIRLSATAQAFTFDAAGSASPAGQSITFTAVRQNIPTATVWSAVASDGGAVTLTGSGDSRALSVANFGVRTWIRVRAESSGFADEMTVVRLSQGATGPGGMTGLLTNESHTLAANPDGVVGSFAGANGLFLVFEGTTDRTSLTTFSVVAASNCTVQINTAANTPVAGQPRGFYRVTAVTADQASATLRAVYGSTTIDKVFTVTRARQGQPGDGQNLLPIEDWVVGTSGSQGSGRWVANGAAAENAIVLGGAGTAPLGPFGTSEILWECRSTDGTGTTGDGGWDVDVDVDHRRTYRSTVWVRVNQLSGGFYHGCRGSGGSTLNLNGTVNSNPYFVGADLAILGLRPNKWYLSVGVIHGSGYTGGYSGVAGIYDPDTGRRIVTGDEFRNATTGAPALLQVHRCYHAYDSSSVTRQWMPKPRLEEVNGSEPTIDALLGFQRGTPWVTTGDCFASTTAFYKVGGTGNWVSDSVRSAASYRACHLQFKPGGTGSYFMVGINSDPAADASYASIDFAWYCNFGGALQIYESGVFIGDFGTYTSNTELAITFDGTHVRYYKDRQLVRGPIAGAAVPYGLDSSFHTPGGQANSVRFGPGIEFETISTGEIAPGAVNEIEYFVLTGPIARTSGNSSGAIPGSEFAYGVVTSAGMLVVTATVDAVKSANGSASINVSSTGHTGGAASGGAGGLLTTDVVSRVLRSFIPVNIGDNITLSTTSKVTGIPSSPPGLTCTVTLTNLEYQVEFAKR